jgi:hypothetical protein
MQLTKLSIAIASVCAIGLAMSQQASAAVATAASGTGSLILAVVDTTTGATFFQDLGKPTASMTPTTNASFVSDVHLDANYQALLAQAGTGTTAHQLAFAVVGGANGVNAPGGANDYLTTSGIQTYGPNQLTNANLRNFNLIDQNVNNALNGITESANKTFFVDPNNTVGGPTTPVYTQASGLWTWNGKTSINTVLNVGSGPSNFFYLTGTGTLGHATPTLEGTMSFSGGVLTFASSNSGAPVPLPAAVWLLGSGLAGLVGVGRRRRSAV